MRAKKLTSTSIDNKQNRRTNQLGLLAALLALGLVAALLVMPREAECSIGYFEHYGWPTYGIVKPFWMTPFSAFPSRSISGYSRKHAMYNGRGLLRFNDY